MSSIKSNLDRLNDRLDKFETKLDSFETRARELGRRLDLDLDEPEETRGGSETDEELSAIFDDPEYKQALNGLNDANRKHYIEEKSGNGRG